MRVHARRWLALTMLGAMFALTLLDGTIVYPAMRQIRSDLDHPAIESRWIMICYLAAFGGLLVLCHRLADRLDRRWMFITGVAVFVGASLLAANAWSFDVLLTARVAQGAGAAIIAPTALPLLVMIFHDTPGYPLAMRTWMLIGAVTGTLGLVVGGLLANDGWRWIFLLNLPIGVAVLLLSPILPGGGPRSRPPAQRLELIQTANVTVAMVLLIMAIAGITPSRWDADTTVILLVGVVALVLLYVVTQRRSWPPISPWRLLQTKASLGAVLILVIAGLAFDGTLLLLMHYALDIRGLSGWQFALTMTVLTISAAGGSVAAQVMANRYSTRTVAIAGTSLLTLGFLALMPISGDGSLLGELVTGLVLIGLGLGAAFVAAQVTVVMEAARMASATSNTESGLADTSFAFGGAMGLGLLSTVAASAGFDALASRPSKTVVDLTADLVPAFGVAAACAVIGLMAAILLLPQAFRTMPDAIPGAKDSR